MSHVVFELIELRFDDFYFTVKKSLDVSVIVFKCFLDVDFVLLEVSVVFTELLRVGD